MTTVRDGMHAAGVVVTHTPAALPTDQPVNAEDAVVCAQLQSTSYPSP